jgi:hypothetical protein
VEGAVSLPIPGIPDWRDAAGYADLAGLEAPGFAWEWLRRRSDYREQALRSLAAPADEPALRREQPAALTFGLHAFEDPGRSALLARPVWAASRLPSVLKAIARPARHHGDAFNLESLEAFATLIESPVHRLLLSDGLRSVRLDVAGSLRPAGVILSFELIGLRTIGGQLRALHQLRALVARGRFMPSLHPPPRRNRRLIALLRAFDAIENGATQSEIAAMILDARFERSGWRVEAPSVRARAQRLVRSARQLAAGAFWTLLD